MAEKFNLDEYCTVNDRIEAFYKKFPEGSIQSDIIKDDGQVVIFKAYVYRDREDSKPATGHAMEKEGSSYINKTSHYENCETSAVGRALAMLGFEIKKAIASKEEVANAKLNQPPKFETKPKPVNNPFVRNAEVVADGKISTEQAKMLYRLSSKDLAKSKAILSKLGFKTTFEITDAKFEEVKKALEDM